MSTAANAAGEEKSAPTSESTPPPESKDAQEFEPLEDFTAADYLSKERKYSRAKAKFRVC